MTQERDDSQEPRWIRTCFVSTPDGDVISAFAIDGRRYADARQAQRVYDEASAEMGRLLGCLGVGGPDREPRRASVTPA